MHTLFDFISSVNAIQFGLALLSIIGFILFNEILKPRPFDGLVKDVTEDMRYMRAQGKWKSARLAGKIAAAPVYILAYLAALPLLFLKGLAVLSARGISSVTSAGWSPVRAYFAGRKKIGKSGRKTEKSRESRGR